MGTKGLEATVPSAACSGLPSQNIKLMVLFDINDASNRRDSAATSPTLLFRRQSSHSAAGVRRKQSKPPGTEQIINYKTHSPTARVSRGRYKHCFRNPLGMYLHTNYSSEHKQ